MNTIEYIVKNPTLSPIFWLLVITIITIIFSKIRKVPANTTIIIDRNTHFHKKKSHGYYFFNSRTDKITSKISTNEVSELYFNTFETHDSGFYKIVFSVIYKSEDINMTLSALEDSRRSIYDVVNCSMETTIASFRNSDFTNSSIYQNLHEAAFSQLESMLEPFYIDVIDLRIINIISVNSNEGVATKFTKHVSSGDDPLRNI